MIFLTVGTQLPFDRLVAAVDAWAGRHRDTRVVAQVGPSTLKTRHLDAVPFMDTAAFAAAIGQCRAVVAHAGIGTILGGLEQGKPVIVMPRRAALGEHRNDHQLATVAGLSHLENLRVAPEEDTLHRLLDSLAAADAGERMRNRASDALVSAIRSFIKTAEMAR